MIDEEGMTAPRTLGRMECSGITTIPLTMIRRSFVSLKKQYLKSRDRCKVTFRLPKAAAPGAKTVHIVGEFNNWSTVETPMKRLKNGEFTVIVDLMPGQAYQFRYLIDQTAWENDWEADRYVKSDFGDCENSVVVV
jgi:1,4-alpha-glucan branching enzyme